MDTAEDFIIAPAASTSGKRLRVRLGEYLFRRWWLLLIPIVLIGGLGLVQAKDMTRAYRSVGKVNVASSTFLSDITSLNTPSFGYETPAAKTARDMNQRLSTKQFAEQVAAAAGLSSALKNGAYSLDLLRQSVWASANGDNLIEVIALTGQPQLSQRLASAATSTYINYVLTTETAGATGAITFLQDSLQTANDALTSANRALDVYVQDNPAPKIGSRPEDQRTAIQRLNTSIANAQGQVDTIQDQINTATANRRASESDINQRIAVIDQPEIPIFSEPINQKRVLTFGIYLVLGVMISIVALVVMALLDHTVLSPADIATIGGLAVVATIPLQRHAKRSNRSLMPELSRKAPS